MRTRKPHWPSKSPLQVERPVAEHLLSERALRDRLREMNEGEFDREDWLLKMDEAIRESRIS